MTATLMKIEILSIYTHHSKPEEKIPMPDRIAKCTPDTKVALEKISEELETMGGKLILSDLFRTDEMQYQAHLDFINKKKKAFSPKPGFSMHQAGRAFDIDLSAIKIKLSAFWEIAKKYGVLPVIEKPLSSAKEAWHFDCRGSHQKVYDYYKAGKSANLLPYEAMAVSANLSIGAMVEMFEDKQKEAFIQCALIRLDQEIGAIDGFIGEKTKKSLQTLGLNKDNIDKTLEELNTILKTKFPEEF
jgi:hypothetical protein